MAGSPHSFWILTTAFLCLLCGSQSLLSDYKICGDPACESLMSRVQALRDHRSDDCRFLSFRRGETIFVYYKLTGRREDLWAGTINKRFGYFPKDLVQEEQAYAVMDKVVETRKEDFFCMDEFGYPIDSSHLDNDDEQINGKMQRQGSETSTSATDGLKVGSILRSTDPSSQSSASAKEVQEDQEKYIEDTIKETIVSSVALKNQESISSSTWSSSVTGWLGLTEEHQPSNMVEAEKGDEKKETLSQTSLPTSLTGWLRFGGERKPDSTKEMVKHEETYHSVSSTKKGHLELRSRDMDTIDKEREKQEETYRARKMSLELEGSQSNDEGKKVEQEEESRSNSWLDMGIRMLGLKKDAVRDEEKAKSGIEEIEEGKVETESQHTDITQLKPVQMTNDPIVVESKTTEPVKRKLVSSMSQTSDNNDEVEDFKGYEEKNDSIDVIRPADLAAEDHQMLKAVSNDPQEGPSVEKTGSVNGGDRDAEYSLNPNNSQTMGQNDNDEKKQDISGKTGTEESSEETPNHVNAFEVQSSAEENLAGGQSHVSFFFGKDGLIQDEPKNYTSNTTEDINDYVGIDTTPKILDQEDLTKPVQSSSEESEVMKMGSKVSEEQEMIHLEEEEIRNLRETDEILEEKPPGKTELKNESEERKLDVMEIEGMEVKKKQKEVQKFHEKEKLANLSEEETEEEIKEGLKLKKKAETVEIKEERRPIELEKIQEKDTGVKGKQVYKDLDTPELGSAPQQKIILETLSAENAEDKKQGKDINPDEMKEKETETVNQAESKNVENNSQVCSHGICPNSSKVGPEEDGNKGTVKGGGSQSTEILSEEKDLPSRINEKIRVHPGNEENTPSLKEGILESHDLDSEVQKEGRGSLGEGTWNLVTVTKDSQISSAESSRTPNDPSRDRSTSGTFGFLKNAMGLFSQTLNTEPKDSPKVQQLVVKPSEAPLMEASGTTEKDLDSTINSSPNQLTDPDSPKTQPQLHPLSGDTSMDEATQSLENLIQIQNLSKSYPNILVHISLVDITVMLEKLGPHKLMSLELILTDLNDPDHDLSVVLDMERLLQNHIETLLVPSLGVDGTLSEDKEKTKTLIALQKMEMLLKEIRKTFNMGHVDLQDHTDEVKWVDPSCSSNMNSIEGYNDGDLSGTDDYPEAHEDNKHQKGWMSLDKEQSPVDIVTEAHSVSEEVKAGSSSGQRASLPHIEQLSKEVKHKTFSFLDQWAEGLATRTLKILELLWLTEHVRDTVRFDCVK
uniref:SH3 domain-containing protein n=1 Tax=Gouania willdenowi TaxID=441366 RepID=A0A8C5E0W9_GOUWI